VTQQEPATVDATSRDQVVACIQAILPRVARRELADLTEATHLPGLGLSSATMLELMLEVEDSLEIQVDVEDFDDADAETIGSLADYIATHSVSGL
jgi:acyl carrier protein